MGSSPRPRKNGATAPIRSQLSQITVADVQDAQAGVQRPDGMVDPGATAAFGRTAAFESGEARYGTTYSASTTVLSSSSVNGVQLTGTEFVTRVRDTD